MSDRQLRTLIDRGFDGIHRWEHAWRAFAPHRSLAVEQAEAEAAIDALVARLADNYPFFHPDYAGQMLRPPHAVALAAYAITARINPNNHALDGGPATAALERECMAQLAAMFGFAQPWLGHLTSSGTIANLEALWVASRLHPGKAIALSQEAHYTHERMCELLGVRTKILPVDRDGRLSLDALEQLENAHDIGTLVLTLGATATGALDPLARSMQIARERRWRLHIDAAYGGFFSTIADLPAAQMDAPTWRAVAKADSVVVDPHKHGLQPYGCGAVLFADPSVGALYKHDSPYTYFTSGELHLGEISLECSRPGAAAAALWATLRCFPLDRNGLGRSLLASRRAALAAFDAIERSTTLTAVVAPELDIITVAPLAANERDMRASIISERSAAIFQSLMQAATAEATPRYLALWRVPRSLGQLALPQVAWDEEYCTVLRSVLMKPEHEDTAVPMIERLAAWPQWIKP